MKSEWRVTSNPIGGKTMYAVYRLMDVYEVDHSGNREFAGDYIVDKQVALSTARALNQSESETKTQLIEEAKKIQEAWANLRKHGALGMYDVHNHDAVEINLWLKFFLQYFPEFEIVERNWRT